MDQETFKTWLDAYGRAWETRDARAAADLFAEDSTYRLSPFEEPMRGRSAVFEYWSNATRSQEQIRFGCEVLSVNEKVGVARWRVSFIRVPSKTRVELDGIFIVALDKDGRAKAFREWWHRRESSPDQPERKNRT